MRADAHHDGAGHVRLTITPQDDAPASCTWSASIAVSVEADHR